MKIFVSWSGQQSHEVALVLREWLPTVIQRLHPWVSSEDIEKGAGWLAEIDQELLTTDRGIVCVTPGNDESAWLNYEAGALAKRTGQKRVCVALLGVSNADIRGPLKNFQTTDLMEKSEVWKLLKTFNDDLEQSQQANLTDELLRHTFEREWETLHDALLQVQARSSLDPADQPKRENRELLEEILTLVREQSRRSLGSSLEGLLTENLLINRPDHLWPSASWNQWSRGAAAANLRFALSSPRRQRVRVADLEHGGGYLVDFSESAVVVDFDDGTRRNLSLPRWELKVGFVAEDPEPSSDHPDADDGDAPVGV